MLTQKIRKAKRNSIDWNILDSLIDKGLNCKEIANYYGFNEKTFGLIAKNHLGIYLSIYMAKKKKIGIFRKLKNG